MNKLEILFWRIVQRKIRKDYGADCPDYILGCVSCEAKKTINWIERHIELLKMK